MGRRKPWWLWKAPKCAELEHFDVAFAVKEYIQNQIGQVLKGLETMEWSDWAREDLTACSSAQREEWKKKLEKDYPGMLTGPHGASIRKRRWLPLYILHARIPHNILKRYLKEKDLKICSVLWHHSSGRTGLTFYNNHLDDNARFETFVIDGATTSRKNFFAIGEKGKGFILATQYLFEDVYDRSDGMTVKLEDSIDDPLKKSPNIELGVSFRVGHKIGEIGWKNKSRGQYGQQLKVTMDDLTPLTVDDLLKQQDDPEDSDLDGWNADGGLYGDTDGYGDPSPRTGSVRSQADRLKAQKFLTRVYQRRIKYLMAAKRPTQPRADYYDPRCEQSLVATDGVAITILGLSGDLTPRSVFSGTYGIVPMPLAWRVSDTPIEFFKPARNSRVEFYLRNQFVPSGPSLNRLGVNYHGLLDITADRVAILTRGEKFQRYRGWLNEAAHRAFRPEYAQLAVEIAEDILTDERTSGASIGHLLTPLDREHGEDYKKAFEEAWRTLDEKLPKDISLFPYQQSSTHDLDLIEELGMKGRMVQEHVMRILKASGAFTTIQEHAGNMLKRAAVCTEDVPGLSRLRHGLRLLLPEFKDDEIQMREYRYLRPKAVYDKTSKTFSIGVPKSCEAHNRHECLCWVGLYLSEAVKSYEHITGNRDGLLSSLAFWRAYNACMKTSKDMRQPTSSLNSHGPSSLRKRKRRQKGPEVEDNMEVDRVLPPSQEPHREASSVFSAGLQGISSPARQASPVREPSQMMSPVQTPAMSPSQQLVSTNERHANLSQVTTGADVAPTALTSRGSGFDDLCSAEALIRSAKAAYVQEQDRVKSLQEHLLLAKTALDEEQKRTNTLQVDLAWAGQEMSSFQTTVEERKTQHEQLKSTIQEERTRSGILEAKLRRLKTKHKRLTSLLSTDSDEEGGRNVTDAEVEQPAAKKPRLLVSVRPPPGAGTN